MKTQCDMLCSLQLALPLEEKTALMCARWCEEIKFTNSVKKLVNVVKNLMIDLKKLTSGIKNFTNFVKKLVQKINL